MAKDIVELGAGAYRVIACLNEPPDGYASYREHARLLDEFDRTDEGRSASSPSRAAARIGLCWSWSSASALDRSPSSVFQELKRNGGSSAVYKPAYAGEQ